MILTGRTRYRELRRLLRPSLLILQVEVGVLGDNPFEGRSGTHWRDAKADDLPILQEHRDRLRKARNRQWAKGRL